MKRIQAVLVALALVPLLAFAGPPTRPFTSFAAAKDVARNAIYSDQRVDFYCGCAFAPNKTKSGGVIDPTECGYTPRKNKTRGKVLEWEHVMPAWFFGHTRTCWSKGHAKCVKKDGTSFKGRDCCGKVDTTFKKIEADLHNLTPAVGELNGDRSNKPYGVVAGDVLAYGKCEFKIGGKPSSCEPRKSVKGDAARIWLYMAETYKVNLSTAQRQMFGEWSELDPVDQWERLRDTRIEAAQGNHNPHVK